MLRRLFIQRLTETLILFSGIVIGFRWIRVGTVDNSSATTAARTFNNAIMDHRKGRSNLLKAFDKTTDKNWQSAKDLYTEAHIEYYEAYKKYKRAYQVSQKSKCYKLTMSAKRYMKYCNRMEDASEIWAKATESFIKNQPMVAQDQLAKAKKLRKEALGFVENEVPKERNTANIEC